MQKNYNIMKNYEIENSGQKKIKEYVDRIKTGESKDGILEGLPDIFKTSIEKELERLEAEENKNFNEEITVPSQYEGLPSFVLEEIWTIPVYVDTEKTRAELEKKQKVLEILKQKETEKDTDEEKGMLDGEKVEEIRQKMGLVPKIEQAEIETPFNKFSVANGETDNGVFWYQYRNKKAKELKETGQFEWGKERIYFDIKMEDMEKLRDLVMHVAGRENIAIAFKYLDSEKTLPIQKDGKETRFVVNFATEGDAKKFLLSIKNESEYKSFISDRNLSHDGIRVDGIAEYASGFREGRAALERIMQGAFSDDKSKYTYKSEYGREITINPDQYDVFKKQYDKFSNEIAAKQKEWVALFKSN